MAPTKRGTLKADIKGLEALREAVKSIIADGHFPHLETHLTQTRHDITKKLGGYRRALRRLQASSPS